MPIPALAMVSIARDPITPTRPRIASAASAPKLYTEAPTLEAVAAGAVVERGQSGEAVRELQRLLNASGAGLELDGKFGEKTQAALERFQQRVGIEASGRA